jgi:hypothetical protein
VTPRGKPVADLLERAFEVDEPAIANPGTQPIAIRLLERRAGKHQVVWRCAQQCVQRVEPRPAIGVLERHASGHLGDVLCRVVIVGVDECAAESRGEPLTERRLAGARHSHDDDDHRCGYLRLVTGWPPNLARIIASTRRP